MWLDLNLPKREKYVFTGLRTGGSGPGRQVEPRALRSRVEPGLPGEIGVGSHGELLICPESGIKREKQGQNLKGQRVHFTVQKGDGLKQAGTVVQMVKNPLAMQETRVPSPGQEGLLEKDVATRSRARPRRLEINLLDCLSLCRLVSRIRSRDEPVCFLGFLTSASGRGGGEYLMACTPGLLSRTRPSTSRPPERRYDHCFPEWRICAQKLLL